MASFKKRYESSQKKKAISLMKEMIKLIETGKYQIQEAGLWNGLEGKLNLKIIVKESDS